MENIIKLQPNDRVVFGNKKYVATYIDKDTTEYIGKNIGGGYVLVAESDFNEWQKWQNYWNDCDNNRI